MPNALTWDDRKVTFGVDHGVIYSDLFPAEPWNGLVSVKTDTTTSELEDRYFDGQKYDSSVLRVGVSVAVEAATYPDRLDSAEPVRLSGMSWRNLTPVTYELHILYNVTLVQKDISRMSLDDSQQMTLFAWEGVTAPSFSTAMLATSHVTIMAERTTSGVLELLENLLYGTDKSPAILPTLDEIVSIFENQTVFIIVDNGDGTWTAIGPDNWINMVAPTEFMITTPSAYFIDSEKYRIRSW